MRSFDVLVVGGGLVGAAIAYGLARGGAEVGVLDEGDVALRASRGNFGLVWVQGKGAGTPAYAEWSRHSADLWPGFAAELERLTGISPDHHQPGGLYFCLSEAEYQKRSELLQRLHNQSGPGGYQARMLGRDEVRAMVPGVGPEVVGASFSARDGHANPLRLLRSLHRALALKGGGYFPERAVERIEPGAAGFTAVAGSQRFVARQIVLAAGLGLTELAPQVRLEVPVRPLKGQMLVTERLPPLLHHPTHIMRQTAEGGLMLGDSHEDKGFDTGSTVDVMGTIAARAVRTLPRLEHVQIVRAWGALRVMTPDGLPIYAQSARYPGAFAVTCHSGVTLAAAHALDLAPTLLTGRLAPSFAPFGPERLRVQAH